MISLSFPSATPLVVSHETEAFILVAEASHCLVCFGGRWMVLLGATET